MLASLSHKPWLLYGTAIPIVPADQQEDDQLPQGTAGTLVARRHGTGLSRQGQGAREKKGKGGKAKARSIHGILPAIRAVYEREGLEGLYAGLSSCLVGVGLSSGIYYFWSVRACVRACVRV